MSAAIRLDWMMGKLRQFLLPLLFVYFLMAGGTYNGSVLFTLQRANYYLFMACGLVWLFWRWYRRRSFPTTPLDGLLAAWLAAVLLAALFSSNVRLSLENVTAYLVYVLVYYLVVDLLRGGWPRDTWVNALLISSLVVLAFGMYEVISWYVRWLAIGGWEQLIPPRVRATLGHPNIAAAYINLMLPIGLAAAAMRRGKLRWLLLVWAGVGLGLVYFTSSRGGWLGTLAALGILAALLMLDNRAPVRRGWDWLRARWWALTGIIAAGIAVTGFVETLLIRQAQHPSHAQGDPRGYIWVVALDMFKDHPLLGDGPGTYGIDFLRRYSIPPGMLLAHAHNFALNTLGEMGAVGALVLAAMTIGIVLTLRRVWISAPVGERALTAGMIASLVGLAVHSQFDTPETVIVIDLLTAVVLGLLVGMLPRKASSTFSTRCWVSWPLWLGMAGALNLWGWSMSGYTAYNRALEASYVGDWGAAAEWMDASLRREPDLALYWFQDGFAHGMLALNLDGSVRNTDELQKGLGAYERGIAMEDGYALNWANLGWLRYHAGDREGALEAFTQAARLARYSIDIQRIYVRTLEQLGPDEGITAIYLWILEMERSYKNSTMFYYTAINQGSYAGLSLPKPTEGWLALDRGDYAIATELFSKQSGINNAFAFYGLSMALINLGDYSGAEGALRAAEFIGGDPLIVYKLLTTLYERSGDTEKLVHVRSIMEDLRSRTSVFGTGKMGESAYAWYVYHRESLPLDFLPGLKAELNFTVKP